MLEIIKPHVEKSRYSWKSLYRCSCGTEKLMLDNNVKSGKSKSCGCLQKKAASKNSKTHGLFGTRTHSIWQGIKGRCLVKSNGNYANYGGAGITICDRWLKLENFVEDMGLAPEGMTIDRIDGCLGYSVDNCRWATYREQAVNTKISTRNKTGIRGVSYLKSRKKYIARITVNNKTTCLGYFDDIEDAASARRIAEIENCNIA